MSEPTQDRDISAYSCGCDPGIKHHCETHRARSNPQPGFVPARDLAKPSTHPEEIRIVDPTTGGQKGSKLARFDLIPPEPLWALAEHYGRGALKYDDRNYEKGYKWGLSFAALQRHLYQWVGGESFDAETGTHHLISAAWHCFALFLFETRTLGTDDIRRHP